MEKSQTFLSTKCDNEQLALIVKRALPAMSGETVTYNAAKNIFMTAAYTSLAGNSYFKTIQISKRLIIYYEIGVGYAHTFLNGITLYGFDGHNANIIGRKSYSCLFFNEIRAKEESVLILKNFIEGQAKMSHALVSDQQMLSYSRQLVEETQVKQLA